MHEHVLPTYLQVTNLSVPPVHVDKILWEWLPRVEDLPVSSTVWSMSGSQRYTLTTRHSVNHSRTGVTEFRERALAVGTGRKAMRSACGTAVHRLHS